jgi:IS5 family transposase
MDLQGNHYDGHSLSKQIEQVKKLVEGIDKITVYTDRGYRGHGHEGDELVIDRERRGSLSKREWKCLKRRSAIEPLNGHLKSGHRLERNWLKGRLGDRHNCVFSAAGFNFRKLLRAIFWPLFVLLLEYRKNDLSKFSMTAFLPAFAKNRGFSVPTMLRSCFPPLRGFSRVDAYWIQQVSLC